MKTKLLACAILFGTSFTPPGWPDPRDPNSLQGKELQYWFHRNRDMVTSPTGGWDWSFWANSVCSIRRAAKDVGWFEFLKLSNILQTVLRLDKLTCCAFNRIAKESGSWDDFLKHEGAMEALQKIACGNREAYYYKISPIKDEIIKDVAKKVDWDKVVDIEGAIKALKQVKDEEVAKVLTKVRESLTKPAQLCERLFGINGNPITDEWVKKSGLQKFLELMDFKANLVKIGNRVKIVTLTQNDGVPINLGPFYEDELQRLSYPDEYSSPDYLRPFQLVVWFQENGDRVKPEDKRYHWAEHINLARKAVACVGWFNFLKVVDLLRRGLCLDEQTCHKFNIIASKSSNWGDFLKHEGAMEALQEIACGNRENYHHKIFPIKDEIIDEVVRIVGWGNLVKVDGAAGLLLELGNKPMDKAIKEAGGWKNLPADVASDLLLGLFDKRRELCRSAIEELGGWGKFLEEAPWAIESLHKSHDNFLEEVIRQIDLEKLLRVPHVVELVNSLFERKYTRYYCQKIFEVLFGSILRGESYVEKVRKRVSGKLHAFEERLLKKYFEYKFDEWLHLNSSDVESLLMVLRARYGPAEKWIFDNAISLITKDPKLLQKIVTDKDLIDSGFAEKVVEKFGGWPKLFETICAEGFVVKEAHRRILGAAMEQLGGLEQFLKIKHAEASFCKLVTNEPEYADEVIRKNGGWSKFLEIRGMMLPKLIKAASEHAEEAGSDRAKEWIYDRATSLIVKYPGLLERMLVYDSLSGNGFAEEVMKRFGGWPKFFETICSEGSGIDPVNRKTLAKAMKHGVSLAGLMKVRYATD